MPCFTSLQAQHLLSLPTATTGDGFSQGDIHTHTHTHTEKGAQGEVGRYYVCLIPYISACKSQTPFMRFAEICRGVYTAILNSTCRDVLDLQYTVRYAMNSPMICRRLESAANLRQIAPMEFCLKCRACHR